MSNHGLPEAELKMMSAPMTSCQAEMVAAELREDGNYSIARFRAGYGWHVLTRPWSTDLVEL